MTHSHQLTLGACTDQWEGPLAFLISISPLCIWWAQLACQIPRVIFSCCGYISSVPIYGYAWDLILKTIKLCSNHLESVKLRWWNELACQTIWEASQRMDKSFVEGWQADFSLKGWLVGRMMVLCTMLRNLNF